MGRHLSDKPFVLREILDIALQIADALQAIHEAGIIHGDIKSGNILIRDDGSVKILDFGLAKFIEMGNDGDALSGCPPLRNPLLIPLGLVRGTVSYMSPEQARGNATDEQTDLWSFGVVLYEMITGRHPFVGKTSRATTALISKGKPAPFEVNIPAELSRILRNSLQKDRAKRYLSASDLLLDLKALKHRLELPKN